ncbi:MAG: phosphate signaling complex protein PhoU [bacterium]|nr:phosphate signaling complex protein PhoU [bacterium]
MLDDRLTELKGRIVLFAALVEQMKDKSIRGLIDRNDRLLNEVITVDEPKSNAFELEIDELCINLIAQFQPMAKDLRTILVVYNMNNALERMGDHMVNIAESALELIKRPPIKPFIDIPRMNDLVKQMLSDCINTFINGDPGLAKEVCERDSLVDALKDQIIRELITFMTEDTSIIGGCLHIMRIAENLERIADLATNICEDVIFMSEGKVVKHPLSKQK